jgi:hypothetical protein
MMLLQESVGRFRRDFFPLDIIFNINIAQKTQRFALFRAVFYDSKNEAFCGFNKVFGEKHQVLLIELQGQKLSLHREFSLFILKT